MIFHQKIALHNQPRTHIWRISKLGSQVVFYILIGDN